MNLFRLALLASALLSTCAMAQYQLGADTDSGATTRDPRLSKIGVEQRLGQKVQGLATFTDDTGKSVQFSSLLGQRPIVLMPIFYRCTGACEIELDSVVDGVTEMATRTVGKDFDVVVVGINPKEGPQLAAAKKVTVLQTYGRPETAAGWRFLTGDMTNIRAITDSVGFSFTYDPVRDQVAHPAAIMVLTKEGVISSYLLQRTFTPKRLGDYLDIASKGDVGQKSEEKLFGCIHIDPLTGERSLVIVNVLKLLAATTVIGLLATIVILSRRSAKA